MSIDYHKLNKERLATALQVVKNLDLDVLVATTHDNFRFITGRRNIIVMGWDPSSMVVLTRGGDMLYQDSVEYLSPSPLWANNGAALAQQRFWSNFSMLPVTLISDLWIDWLAKALEKLGVKRGRLGLDKTPWQWYMEMKRKLPGMDIVDAEEELALARAIKTPEEVKLLRRAGEVAAKGMNAAMGAIKPGMKELELLRVAMATMYAEGSEGDAFHPFLSSGPCVEATIHPSNRTLQDGDPVQMGLGPIIEGYCGDCSRTGFVGKPTKEFKDLYKTVYESLRAVIKNTRPGIKMSELARIQTKVIADNGYDHPALDYGHGVGLLHCCELPNILRKEDYEELGRRDMTLSANMVFACEPRLYKMINERAFIQCALEDTILVTETGCEVITPAKFIEEIIA